MTLKLERKQKELEPYKSYINDDPGLYQISHMSIKISYMLYKISYMLYKISELTT